MSENRKQIKDNLIAIVGDRGQVSDVKFTEVNGGLEVSVDLNKPATSVLRRLNYAGLDAIPNEHNTSFSFVAPNEHAALMGTSSGLRDAIVQSFVDDVARAQALIPADRHKDFSTAMIKNASEAITPQSRGKY